jgi:hypothetical protein
MISMITNRGQMSFMVLEESFRYPVLLRFLRRLTWDRERLRAGRGPARERETGSESQCMPGTKLPRVTEPDGGLA